MSNKLTILVVDDDKFLRKVINKTLSPHFDVILCESGETALEHLCSFTPDLILLDVEMPGLNGYDVCLRIKESPNNAHIPIIFLSGRGSIQERMCGFDCGADDYLIKPFDADVLIAKIRVLLKYSAAQKDLKSAAVDAHQTAMTALTGSSELGQAMQLVQRSHACGNLDALAQLLFGFTSQLGLNCSLLFKTLDNQHLSFCANGQCSPMELELMILLREKGRIFDFSSRTQFNFSRLSLLVKNMPLINPDQYGRYKDLLPAVLGALDARVTVIEAELATQRQTQALAKSFDKINKSLTSIVQQIYQNHTESANSMTEMLSALENKFLSLGLDEDQEKYLIQFVEQHIQKSIRSSDNTTKIEHSIKIVIQALTHLLAQQNALLQTAFIHQEALHEEMPDDESVTLF